LVPDYARVVLFLRWIDGQTHAGHVAIPFASADFWPLRRMPATVRIFGRELRTREAGDERHLRQRWRG